jgi:hypothetical protein
MTGMVTANRAVVVMMTIDWCETIHDNKGVCYGNPSDYDSRES